MSVNSGSSITIKTQVERGNSGQRISFSSFPRNSNQTTVASHSVVKGEEKETSPS